MRLYLLTKNNSQASVSQQVAVEALYFSCRTKHVVALATKYCLNEMRFLLCVCVLHNCAPRHLLCFCRTAVAVSQRHLQAWHMNDSSFFHVEKQMSWWMPFVLMKKNIYPQRQRLSTQQGPSVSAVFAWHNRKWWRLPVPTCQKCGLYVFVYVFITKHWGEEKIPKKSCLSGASGQWTLGWGETAYVLLQRSVTVPSPQQTAWNKWIHQPWWPF